MTKIHHETWKVLGYSYGFVSQAFWIRPVHSFIPITACNDESKTLTIVIFAKSFEHANYYAKKYIKDNTSWEYFSDKSSILGYDNKTTIIWKCGEWYEKEQSVFIEKFLANRGIRSKEIYE